MTKEEEMVIRKLELIDRLKEHGITKIVVDYDGSGDSGEINSVTGFMKGDEEADLGAITVRGKKEKQEFVDGKWIRTNEEQDMSLYDLCEELCSDFLAERGIDWYNNEGGYGSFTVTVRGSKARLDHSYRIESTTEESHDL